MARSKTCASCRDATTKSDHCMGDKKSCSCFCYRGMCLAEGCTAWWGINPRTGICDGCLEKEVERQLGVPVMTWLKDQLMGLDGRIDDINYSSRERCCHY